MIAPIILLAQLGASYDSFGCLGKKRIKVGVYITADVLEEYERLDGTLEDLKRELEVVVDHTRVALKQFNIALSIRHFLVDAHQRTERYHWNKENFSSNGFPMGLSRELDNIAIADEEKRSGQDVRNGNVAAWFIIYKHVGDSRSGYAYIDTFGTQDAVAAVAWNFTLSEFAEQGGRRLAYLNSMAAMLLHEFGHLLGFIHDTTTGYIMTSPLPRVNITITVDKYWRSIGYSRMPSFRRGSDVRLNADGVRTQVSGDFATKRICNVLSKQELEPTPPQFFWWIIGCVALLLCAICIGVAFHCLYRTPEDNQIKKAESCDVKKAKLHGCDVKKAKLHGFDATKVKLVKKVESYDLDVQKAESRGCDVKKAKLHGCDVKQIAKNPESQQTSEKAAEKDGASPTIRGSPPPEHPKPVLPRNLVWLQTSWRNPTNELK